MTQTVVDSSQPSQPAPPQPQHAAISGPWSYRPALDGLRTIAVYLVLLFHAGIGWSNGGFIGVDLFFVLSGFLVTNVLLEEARGNGRIRLVRFYARRMRRLMPAAILMILATAAVFVLVAPLNERLGLVSDARASLLYVANWRFLADATDYFAEGNAPSPFLHFWSLAIEEQFYFVYPLILIGLLGLARRRSSWVLPAGVGALCAISLGLQWFWNGRSASHAYYGTDARLYQLLAGGLLATTAARWRPRLAHLGPSSGAVAGLGVVALIVVATSAVDVSPSIRGVAAVLCSVVILAGLESCPTSAVAAGLSTRTLTYLGGISYGTYLWHWPVILVLQRIFTIGPTTTLVLAAVLSTALAALSAQLVELPIRKTRALDGMPRQVVAGALAMTTLAAITIVPAALQSERLPVLAQDSMITAPANRSANLRAPVPEGIDWEAVARDAAAAPNCTSADPRGSCVVVPGTGLAVMLIGDSHVRMYIPMFERLAAQHGFEISVSAGNGCSWQDGLENFRDQDEDCARRQEGRYDVTVPALDPDVVVLISRGFGIERSRETRDRATDPVLRNLPLDHVVATTTEATLDELVAQGRKIVILEPVPNPPDNRDMVDCLSGARRIGECAFTAAADPYEPIYRYEAIRRSEVASIDLDRLVCPELPICLPIVDGEPVRRDENHITASFLTNRADQIWAMVTDTGVLEGVPDS